VLEELVESDVRHCIALELDLDPHPGPVRVVLQVGDLGQDLVLDELRDFGDDAALAALLHPVGQLRDDDRRLSPAQLLDVRASAHDDPAPTRAVGIPDPRPADDVAARGKVGPLDVLHQVVRAGVGVVDELDDRVYDLGKAMRGDVRGHPDRDPGRAVHEQVRETARKRQGLAPRLVVVGDVVDGVGIDVAQHLGRDAGEPALGVAHRRGRVVVDRAEVPLSVDERIA
jgi:hypothetical protein